MKITTKFIGSSVLAVGLSLSLIAGSNFLLRRAEQSVVETRMQTRQALEIAMELQVSLRDQIVTLKDFLMLNRDQSDMARYQKANAQFLMSLKALESLIPANDNNIVSIHRRHDKLVRLATGLRDTPSTLPHLQQSIRAINSSLGTDHTPHTLVFEVEDSGAGIAAEDLKTLFEAFTQTETGKQAQEGTGLGLPISRKFVQLMGGEMQVSSRIGTGTTFSFTVQVTEAEASDITTEQPLRRVIALESHQSRYRILIVDDKPLNRQLLVKLLNPLGFELQEAENGQVAVDIWSKWQPHLIWMDMRMPVMDGYTATQTIKRTIQGQATAIIALTASVLEEEKAVVLSAGCDSFLRKPFREAEIFDAMHKYLGVRYVYKDLTLKDSGKNQTVNMLTAAAMATLPTDLLNQLEDAIISCDLGLMATVTEGIALENAPLSEAIATCLNQFEYDQVLNLISADKV